MAFGRCTRKGYAANTKALKRQELRNQPCGSALAVPFKRTVCARFLGLPSIWAFLNGLRAKSLNKLNYPHEEGRFEYISHRQRGA